MTIKAFVSSLRGKSKLEAARAELATLKQEVLALLEDKNTSRAEHDRALESLRQERAELLQQVAALRDLVCEHEDQAATKDKDIELLREALTTMNHDNSDLLDNLGVAEKDCAVLGAHARAAQCLAYQTRDEAQAERQALCIALAQSRVCKRELEQRVAELRAELSKEKEGSAHGEELLHKMQRQAAELQGQVIELHNDLQRQARSHQQALKYEQTRATRWVAEAELSRGVLRVQLRERDKNVSALLGDVARLQQQAVAHQGELAAANEQIARLQCEKSQQLAQLATSHEQAAQLQQQNVVQKQELDAACTELQRALKDASDYKRKLGAMHAGLMSAQQEVANVKASCDVRLLKAQLGAAMHTIAHLQRENAALAETKEQAAQLQADLAQLQQQLTAQQADLAAAHEQAAQLQADKREQQAQLAASHEQAAQLQAECAQLREQLEGACVELRRALKDASDLKRKLGGARAELMCTRQEVTDMKASPDVHALKAQLGACKAELAAATQQAAQLQQQLAAQQTELAAARHETVQLQQQHVQLWEARGVTHQQTLQAEQVRATRRVAEAELCRGVLRVQLRERDNNVSVLLGDVAKLQQHSAAQQAELAAAHDQVAHLQHDNSQQLTQLAAAHAHAAQQQQQNMQLTVQLAAADKQAAQLQAETAQQKQQLEGACVELRHALKDASDYKHKLGDARAELMRVQQQVTDVKASCDVHLLKAQLGACKHTVTTLQQENAGLRSECDTLHQQRRNQDTRLERMQAKLARSRRTASATRRAAALVLSELRWRMQQVRACSDASCSVGMAVDAHAAQAHWTAMHDAQYLVDYARAHTHEAHTSAEASLRALSAAQRCSESLQSIDLGRVWEARCELRACTSSALEWIGQAEAWLAGPEDELVRGIDNEARRGTDSQSAEPSTKSDAATPLATISANVGKGEPSAATAAVGESDAAWTIAAAWRSTSDTESAQRVVSAPIDILGAGLWESDEDGEGHDGCDRVVAKEKEYVWMAMARKVGEQK